jgi:hypothetical protein
MLTIHVRGGTPSQHNGKGLCENCRHGCVARGSRESEVLISCNVGYVDPTLVPFQVVSCSRFSNCSDRDRMDMEKVAWVLNTSKSGQTLGFVSPHDWRDRHAGDGPLDDVRRMESRR